MKTILPLVGIGWASCLLVLSTTAAPFRNLDFEEANVSVITPGDWYMDSTENLIPGWTLSLGGLERPWMLVGGTSNPGVPTAVLMDRMAGASQFIQGRYSIYLATGYDRPSEPRQYVHYSLTQTGDLPVSAQSLRFQERYGFEIFDVQINGLSLDVVRESPSGAWYAVDVSAFSGQTISLEFRTAGGENFGSTSFLLDTIEFSPTPVIPEPSAIGMVACGLGVLLLLRRSGT
ncbi:MAG: hypothetical protein AB7O66_16885 [Limisphaerales bacterium]